MVQLSMLAALPVMDWHEFPDFVMGKIVLLQQTGSRGGKAPSANVAALLAALLNDIRVFTTI